MITLKKVTVQASEYRYVEELYCDAFPESERMPFENMLGDPHGYHELFSAWNADDATENQPVGFIATVTCDHICNIIYFAVSKKLREKGYGSQILQQLAVSKPAKKIVADIEMEDEKSPDNVQRIRRKRFYMRNGFHETGVQVTWHGEAYEMVAANGNLTKEELDLFWKHVFQPVNENH